MKKLNWILAVLAVSALALVSTISFTSGAGGRVSSAQPAVEGEDGMPPLAQTTSAITRRLYEGPAPDTWGTDVSPDGRYLTQTDWDTGDLAVLDLLTGQLRRVTDKGSWDSSSAYSEMSVFSPDGSEIAYLWFNEDLAYEIRVIGVDGSNPRVILPPEPGRWDWPGLYDWSPDGEYLALAVYNGLESEFALLSVRDGSLRVLLDPPLGMGVDFASFSPVGKYIAFVQPSRPASGQDMSPDWDINLISVGGGERIPLLQGPASDELLGWEPDGRSILFKTNRDLTEGIWRLPVIDGRAAGEPELIKGDLWRLQRIGTAGHKIYYGLITDLPQLYTVGLDIPNSRIVSPPTPVEEAAERQVVSPAWSPDGRQLAYVRSRTPSGPSNIRELVIRPLPGGSPRIMPLPVRVIQRIWWAPDGRSLLLAGPAQSWDTPDWRGLFRFDLETGDCTPIETSENVPWWAALTRNLRVAYYDGGGGLPYATQEHPPDALLARDLETGREWEVAKMESSAPYHGYPALSPDEKWLARFNPPSGEPGSWAITIISTESGEVREVHRYRYPEEGSQCGNLLWSPDGRYLIYGVANLTSGGCTLQRLPVDGGDPTPIGDLPSDSYTMNQLNPDGTRLAFMHGEWRGEIWVMDLTDEEGGER